MDIDLDGIRADIHGESEKMITTNFSTSRGRCEHQDGEHGDFARGEKLRHIIDEDLLGDGI